MATLGVRRAFVARVDENFNVLTGVDGINGTAGDNSGVFEINEETSKGVTTANITNLQGATSDIFGSNKLVYKATAKGNPQTVLTANALPFEIKQRLLGNLKQATGGFQMNGKSNANNRIALVIESAESFNETKPVYVGFYGSIVTETTMNMQTNNTAEQRTTDAMTFAHLENGDKGFGQIADSTVSGFDKDKFMKEFLGAGASSANVQSNSSSSSNK